MFVWRKRVRTAWLAANERGLREIAGQRLAIISKANRKSATAEIAGTDRCELEKIRSHFGGTIEKLPRDWLKKFSRAHKSKPLKIGKRLTVISSGKSSSRNLLIPTGAAFGTGEHVTTVMSLHLLAKMTSDSGSAGHWPAVAGSLPPTSSRRRNSSENRFRHGGRNQQASGLHSPENKFSLLDLGTGTGILALAAKRFGAGNVLAVDKDPLAIATAKENARRNKLDTIDFRVADVRRWKMPRRIDIITANLFSGLLIEILPKLKSAQWLILSGILREQESQMLRALRRNGIAVLERRRRGKWIALLGRHPRPKKRDPAAQTSRGDPSSAPGMRKVREKI